MSNPFVITVVYKSTDRANAATLNACPEDINAITFPSRGQVQVSTSASSKANIMKMIVEAGAVEIGRKANQVMFSHPWWQEGPRS